MSEGESGEGHTDEDGLTAGTELDAGNWSMTFSERELRNNIYTCVLVKGVNPAGFDCYAYFGIFYDSLPELRRIALSGKPFNPKDIRAIVLARAMGEPSPEIQEFMRMKFSFSNDEIVLECSGK
jgi:hypothetical protein